MEGAWRGASPEYDPEGDVRVIKTGNVRRFELAATPDEYVSSDFADSCERALIPDSALLITSTGVGSAGRSFVKLGDTSLLADGHITIAPVADENTAAYLCAYLQSPAGVLQLLRLRRGSSRQIEIYPDDMLTIPVPVLDDKRRLEIASIWLSAAGQVRDSATAVLDAEQALAAKAGIDIQQLPRVGGLGWVESSSALRERRRIDAESATPSVERLRAQLATVGSVSLADLAVGVHKGVQPAAYVDDGPVRVVKTKDVRFPELNLLACDSTDEESWPYYLQKGDLVLNITGEGTLGRAGVIPEPLGDEISQVVSAVDVCAIRIDPAMAIPEYVALFLSSPIGRRLTGAWQTGSSGQQHLYPAHFSFVPVFLPRQVDGRPDLDWQQEVVDLATKRRVALEGASASGRALDDEFLSIIGTPADLSLIPY